ncbi:hypothetical protein ACPF7I_05455 [Anoxybacillus sp. D401a]|uniref:hypothetical protein n=1 Tax=Anoxybacillus sp. D401a TaxID=575112 RepID=UPI003D32A05B
MNVQWMRTLFDQSPSSLQPKERTFHLGDMIYGKVEKVKEDGTALVRIGNQMVTAELRSSVKEGGSYAFQVQKTSPLELKILERPPKATDEESIIRHFRLPHNDQTKALIRWMLDEAISLKREQVALMRQWLRTGGEKEVQAIKWMMMNELPFRDDVFRAFLSLQHERPLYEQRIALAMMIDESAQRGETLAKLPALLRRIPSLSSFSPQYIHEVLQEGMKKQEEWLSLLQAAVSEAKGTVKEELTSLWQRMQAYQLLSTNVEPLQHIFMQFPLFIGTHPTDVTIQWRGKKKENGKIDTDYCRILFYLTMATLKETIVDVHIQQRIVYISIINDTPHLSSYVSALEPSLKKQLAEHGYTLSTVHVKVPERAPTKKRLLVEPFSYKGVDYRI